MILKGKSAAPGFVTGSIYIYNKNFIIPVESFISAEDSRLHHERYLSVKEQAWKELDRIRLSMEKVDPIRAGIFRAHQEIVDDITINEEIPARILNDLWAGDWAIYHVYETVLSILRQTADSLIAERVSDFDDVRAMLLKLWYGQKDKGLSSEINALKDPVIIAAYDLKPSDTASLDRTKVLAILSETGGITSHTAIIAKSFGIPTVLGIEGLLEHVKQGQRAAINAGEGMVILDPEDHVTAEFLCKSTTFSRDKEEIESFRYKQCCTSCGEKIDIGVNISNDDELDEIQYADMVGLFRTEFLFMKNNSLPTEEEQSLSYKKVLECFKEKPVVLRLLDIGADKQISYLDMRHEENPFLGNRGIRFCFNNLDIFRTQIRAALRASFYGNLWLMIPMVSSLDDIRRAKNIITEEKDELKNKGIGYGDFKTGIMIEVPSIALIADLAVKEVDFASIGSNDLCQYLCAADRMNNLVESYYQNYHPAVFRLIKEIVYAFNEAGKPVSLCGELGNDPLVAPVLIGLGLRKLSMGAASIAAVKRSIASVTLTKQMADNVLQLQTAEEIEKFLKPS